MSVKAMAIIWESDIPDPTTKLILLAYADHADHQGKNIFPSLGLIAWKCEVHINTARRYTKKLVREGYLVPHGESRLGTNLYSIPLDELPSLPPYVGGNRRGRPPTENPTTAKVGFSGNEKINPTKTEENPTTAVIPDPSLKPSLKTPPDEPKPKSKYIEEMEYLENIFAKERGCSLPDWNGNGSALNKTWRQPMKRILKECDGDIYLTRTIIIKAIRQMARDKLTFYMPIQIEKTAYSLIADYKKEATDPEIPNLTRQRLEQTS